MQDPILRCPATSVGAFESGEVFGELNEEASSLDFEKRVKQYFVGTEEEDRPLCGPWGLAQMAPENQPNKVIPTADATTREGSTIGNRHLYVERCGCHFRVQWDDEAIQASQPITSKTHRALVRCCIVVGTTAGLSKDFGENENITATREWDVSPEEYEEEEPE